jgi:hypothetical protein
MKLEGKPRWVSWIATPFASSPLRWAVATGLIAIILVLGLSGKLP